MMDDRLSWLRSAQARCGGAGGEGGGVGGMGIGMGMGVGSVFAGGGGKSAGGGRGGVKSCPSGCHGRGACDVANGTCDCHPSWSGAGCETPRCPNDCSGRGKCLKTTNAAASKGETAVCLCNTGYVGEDCGVDRFNLTLSKLMESVGSPFTSNAKFAENLDVVMSYKSVHKYGFMLCKTPMCKSSWDFSLTTIFPSLARDDVRFNFADCAVVASGKSAVTEAKAKAARATARASKAAKAAAAKARQEHGRDHDHGPTISPTRLVTTGEEIDRHGMVMRLDNAPTRGFEQWVGKRTTHRMVTAEYAKYVHGLLGSVIQTSNATRTLVNSNGWWDAGSTPADRLVYLMAVKMTTMGKGEWKALDKSSLLPFRDVFPGPRKYVMSPVFMSRAHAAWERLKTMMRDLGLGCYKKKPANTHVPSLFIATLYAMQMCRKVNVYGAGLLRDEDEEEADSGVSSSSGGYGSGGGGRIGGAGEGGSSNSGYGARGQLTPEERQPAYRERDTDCCYFQHSPPYRSDAPTCNYLTRHIALRLLAMNGRITLK